MVLREICALDYVLNHKSTVTFRDPTISAALDKGRLVAGEMLFVNAADGDTDVWLSLTGSVSTHEVIVVGNSVLLPPLIITSAAIRHTTCLHDTVLALESVVAEETKPRVLFVLLQIPQLAGYRVRKLEDLITELRTCKVVVITNCVPIKSIASQTFVLDGNRCVGSKRLRTVS